MKYTKKVLVSAAALLVALSLLAGCTLASSGWVNTEPSATETQPTEPEPTLSPEEQLAEKFGAMRSVDETTNTVTVITEDYLNAFWQDNYAQETVHSLTKEELYFLVDEAVMLYRTYDAFVLPGISCKTEDPEVARRFPSLETQVLHKESGHYLDGSNEAQCIFAIVHYWMRALSSPGAFISGLEELEHLVEDPGVLYSPHYRFRTFYIPGFSADTDRQQIISDFDEDMNLKHDLACIFDSTGWPQARETVAFKVIFYYENGEEYDLLTKKNMSFPNMILAVSQPGEIYHAGQMKLPYFMVYCQTQTFWWYGLPAGDFYRPGSVKEEGDKLTMTVEPFYGEHSYIFYRQEDGSYRYCAAESTPIESGNFPIPTDGTLFYPLVFRSGDVSKSNPLIPYIPTETP